MSRPPSGDIDDAIALINGRDRPLALYCFTRDRAALRHVLDRTVSGGVTVNGTILHVAQTDLPFGGVGPSGIGAYHGRNGFRRMSHARAVCEIGPVNGAERLLSPPFGHVARVVAKLLVGSATIPARRPQPR